MNIKNTITLEYKNLAIAFLMIFNVIVITPATFVLKTLWDRSQEYIQLTGQDLELIMSREYVTKQDFRDYQESVDQVLMHIDNKTKECAK